MKRHHILFAIIAIAMFVSCAGNDSMTDLQFVSITAESVEVHKAPDAQSPTLQGFTDTVEGLYVYYYWEGGKRFDDDEMMESFGFSLSKGQIAQVIERQGEWVKVRFDEIGGEGADEGWIEAKNTAEAKPVNLTIEEYAAEMLTEWEQNLKKSGKYAGYVLAISELADISGDCGKLQRLEDGRLVTIAELNFSAWIDEEAEGVSITEYRNEDGEVYNRILNYSKAQTSGEYNTLDFDKFSDDDIEKIIQCVCPDGKESGEETFFFANAAYGIDEYARKYVTYTPHESHMSRYSFTLSVTPITVSKEEPGKSVTLTVDYPAEPGILSDSVRLALYKMIGGEGDELPTDCTEMLENRAKEMLDELFGDEYYGSTNNISCTVESEDDNFVTYAVKSEYYDGGAHGLDEEYSVTFFKSTGETLTKALINTDQPGFKRLLADAIKEHYRQYDYESGLMSDAALLNRLFCDAKTINDLPLPSAEPSLFYSAMVFVYSHYEIAPYSDGCIRAIIPLEQLRPYLAPQLRKLCFPDEEGEEV